jgi:threonine dehydratase
MFTLEELHHAHKVVAAAVPETPQYVWPQLRARVGAEVWVKHENHVPTGAFKVRGGLTYVERLTRERPGVPGLISATRGNHGQSIAFAGRRHGLQVTIVVPHSNSVEKNAAMRALGAELLEHGADFQAARDEAERRAAAGWQVTPFIVIWCSVWLPMRLNSWQPFPILPRSTYRLVWAPVSAAASSCETYSAFKPR